jgi:hypothetical protein
VPLEKALSIVHHPRRSRLEIGNQLVQLRLVPRHAPLPLQHRDRGHDVAAPETAIEPSQQLGFGRRVPPDTAAQLQGFLAEVLPVPHHGFPRDLAEHVGKEAAVITMSSVSIVPEPLNWLRVVAAATRHFHHQNPAPTRIASKRIGATMRARLCMSSLP